MRGVEPGGSVDGGRAAEDLLVSLDALAFGSAPLTGEEASAEGHTAVLGCDAEPAKGDPLSAGDVKAPAAEHASPARSPTLGSSTGGEDEEDAYLRSFLTEPARRTGSLEPPQWRSQVRALLSAGARGTVEDFHLYLSDLLRRGKGRPEPAFLALCASVLSSQTRDTTTKIATRRLIGALAPQEDEDAALRVGPAAVALAPPGLLEQCLHEVNFCKTKVRSLRGLAVALLQEFNGQVPEAFSKLVTLPGVGPKVANLVRAVVFPEGEDQGMVVDTHVHRIARRLGWTTNWDTSPEHTRRKLELFIPEAMREVLTRRLVGFGQEVCLPQRPRCGGCPVSAVGLCPTTRQQQPEGRGPELFPQLKRGAKRTIVLE